MKSKSLKVGFAIIIILLVGFGIFDFSRNVAKAVDEDIITIKEPGTLVEGELNPDTYSYIVNTGTFEAINNTGEPAHVPLYNGFEIYCIYPGAHISYRHDIRLSEARELEGKTYQLPCRFRQVPTIENIFPEEYCASTPQDGATTPPVFEPVGGEQDLPPAMAYVVTIADLDTWTLEKQRAIWNLKGSSTSQGGTADGGLIEGDSEGVGGGASPYDQEALSYAEFDSQVRPEGGLAPLDVTDESALYAGVNKIDKEYIIGPFTIDYINGIYGNVAFGGISEITVRGYNSMGQLIEDDIEIKGLILQDTSTGVFGSMVEPQYFEPDDVYKVDRTEQVYPEPNQQFQVVIDDPNSGTSSNNPSSIITSFSVKVKFQYMQANGKYMELKGTKYTVRYWHDHTYNAHIHEIFDGGKFINHAGCETTCYLEETPQQTAMAVDAIRSVYEHEIELKQVDVAMNLGGHVWEDGLAGKEMIADGLSSTDADKPLQNIKVTLYSTKGEIVGLLPNEDGIGMLNPTYTDGGGNYQFNGLNPMEDYYVVFEYDGQTYMPTEYLSTGNGNFTSAKEMVSAGLYNSSLWTMTSKGTEANGIVMPGIEISRLTFDQIFKTIGAYPNNYISTNSLGVVGAYNSVYTQKDLMGYTMDENGLYHQTGIQLIDGFGYNESGLQTGYFMEGEISTRVKEYMARYGQFPDDSAMLNIYSQIAGGNSEIWRMLQFIEDSKIQAYTGSPFTQGVDTYSVLDYFIIDEEGLINSATINGITYGSIYPGQYYINLGLWKRPEFDASLRKDVYKAALKINNKTVIYNYDKRAVEDGGVNNGNGQDNNTYWDINVRMSDYENYYNTRYNRELYPTDYNYNSAELGHPGIDLEVYVTYKLTIRNQSMSVMSQIQEVVDYYDTDYIFKPNLSWVIYATEGNRTTTISSDEYYDLMNQSQSVIDEESTSATSFITNSKDAQVSEGRSQYGNEKNLGQQYENLYISGLKDKKLATGESAYIYLTFEVKKDAQDKVLLDDESNPKENLAEINGYTTYYRDGTELPNNVVKNSNDIAGLLDRDSTPGNLIATDLVGERYERNFEDDTDRAPSIRIFLDEDAIRRANGTVWEDERTETVGNPESSEDAIIGDGIRQEDEIGIAGVTVQLVEKCTDGSEYIWKETTTDENGRYSFESYIPGDYVIRFYYGDTQYTALTTDNGGSNDVSYNGQDFKSTTYQDGIEQQGATDTLGRYQGYVYTDTQNVTATYNPVEANPTNDTFGYNIYKSDSAEYNYSDAKDIWSTSNREGINIIGPVNSVRLVQGREDVINYSRDDITNHLAEVLASPYERPSYNGTEYTDEEMATLYQELMNETYMTAETGVIVVEFEYDRQQTDGINSTLNNSSNSSKDYIGDNQYNSNYTLNNIDLGLTERPKAQLEIDKSIENVKVTLANNNILFDINEAANNAIWQDHEEYSVDREKIDAEDNSVSDNDYYQEGDAIGMYKEYYGNGHRYSFRTDRDGVNDIVNMTDKGLIQLTMDEELMHGATIQITYTIKITNVGEVDYVDGEYKNFYYRGNTEGAHVSTTTTEQVIDYVQNNLQFEANNEANSTDGWKVITAEDLMNVDLVNDRLTENLAQFNTIIQTENFNTSALRPGEEVSKTLILSQLITPENTDDDLAYTNMVEITKTSNENGRRMAYSVVGNQDPLLDDASELDSSVAERIVILPPFGEVRMYYVIGTIVAVILIAGIVLIKKKVLKKTK